MSPKQRIISLFQGKKVDQIPWAAYSFLLPRGEVERKLREKGCALIVGKSVYDIELSKIEVVERQIWENNEKIYLRIYRTPKGEVSEKIKIGPYKSEWKKEHLIKKPKDYEIVKFIIENTIFHKNYEDFLKTEEDLGEDGIVYAVQPYIERCPFQKLLIDFAGAERTFMDLYDNPSLVEDFLNCLEEKDEESAEIIKDFPAKVVFWLVDNITSDLTPPKFFSKYCLPFYKKYFPLFHENGKVCMVHLDGKLNALKNLIKNTDIDVVSSFTLPGQGGDLSLEEARKVWPNKVIVANVPAFLCFKEEKEIEEYFKNLFESKAARKNFMIEISEDLPPKFWKKPLSILAKAIKEYGSLSL